jgi:hypothetical protein
MLYRENRWFLFKYGEFTSPPAPLLRGEGSRECFSCMSTDFAKEAGASPSPRRRGAGGEV